MTEQPLSPSPHPLPRGERENKNMFATEQQPCPTPSPACVGPLYIAPTFFLALFVMPNGVDLPAAGGYVDGRTGEDPEMPARLRWHARTGLRAVDHEQSPPARLDATRHQVLQERLGGCESLRRHERSRPTASTFRCLTGTLRRLRVTSVPPSRWAGWGFGYGSRRNPISTHFPDATGSQDNAPAR